MTKTSTSLLAALAVAFGASAALAQSPAGSPADPNTNQNQQPGPSVGNPTDPAAGANPDARIPTSPPGQALEGQPLEGQPLEGQPLEGMGGGESGLDAPAGIPADPNTNQNQQPGPSVGNPTDPAAGSDPDARVPTDGAAD